MKDMTVIVAFWSFGTVAFGDQWLCGSDPFETLKSAGNSGQILLFVTNSVRQTVFKCVHDHVCCIASSWVIYLADMASQ